MITLATILAATQIGGMLTSFLFAVLAIALIGGLIWAINNYIYPIPPPILAVVAIVLVILVVLWMLGDFPNGFPR